MQLDAVVEVRTSKNGKPYNVLVLSAQGLKIKEVFPEPAEASLLQLVGCEFVNPQSVPSVPQQAQAMPVPNTQNNQG